MIFFPGACEEKENFLCFLEAHATAQVPQMEQDVLVGQGFKALSIFST
jgi:hypothetical protein